MKLETILKVIEIIRRSGEQSKYICTDDEYFDQAAEYGIAAHKISRHLAKGAPTLRD